MGKKRLAPLIVIPLLVFIWIWSENLPKNDFKDLVSLDKEEYYLGDRPVLTIANTGNDPILIGTSYRIEKKIDDTWEEMSVLGENEAWDAILHIIPSGKVYEQTLNISGSEIGQYKLIKVIRFENENDAEKTFIIDFKITG